MIVRHRTHAKGQPTEYTLACDRVEFIALQCALNYVIRDLTRAAMTPAIAGGIDLRAVYTVMNREIHTPQDV